MVEFIHQLLTTKQFVPHGNCYLWNSGLVWFHAISDSLITVAYYSIPLLLLYFVRQRQDLPFPYMFRLFSAFIIACGTTHLMEVWTIWHPTYWLSGVTKLLTAIISLYTVSELIPVIPQAMALPSPAQLAAINHRLQHQIEEHERLAQLKDDFLSTVSHELRTPLTNIRMVSQMLDISLQQQGLESESNERVTRYLTILRDQCDRELELINDLLDFQRLSADTYDVEPQLIELQTWLTQMGETFLERAASQQRQLQIHINSPLPPLHSDAVALERIISELLNNACKYTPAGEKIWIQSQLIASAETETQPWVEIQVCNTGIEIQSDQLQQVFEPFYRVPQSDRWKQGGTGLGLALVHKLVTRLGGKVWAESGLGQTRFVVMLPCSQPAPLLELSHALEQSPANLREEG